MRIIAGEFRGRLLKSPAGQRTRPTSDRLRETLFNILNRSLDESSRFLDLCAGTGAVGIEAISRGAAHSTFVDKSRRACALIEENLDRLGIPESATEIVCAAAESFVAREGAGVWDLIYYDPPYAADYLRVIHAVGMLRPEILAPGGIFIAEHHTKHELPDRLGGLRRWRIVRQGESSLSFFEQS